MGKKATPKPREIFLGDWLDRWEIGPSAAAKIAGCSQSYISNIKRGEKTNVNALYLLALSEHIGVTVNDFFRKPPPKAHLAEIQEFSPQAQGALLKRAKTPPVERKAKAKRQKS